MASNTYVMQQEDQDARKWRKVKPTPWGDICGHVCSVIHDHRMVIAGGEDADENILSRGMIYISRTQFWRQLPNDMPAARSYGSAVANTEYMYVIGGHAGGLFSKTVYRLLLETYEWTTMAPMMHESYVRSAVLKGNYIYVFGVLFAAIWYCIVDKIQFIEVGPHPSRERATYTSATFQSKRRRNCQTMSYIYSIKHSRPSKS